MDNSSTTEDCGSVLPPASLSYFSMTSSFVLCLCTISGNIMVFLAVLKNPNKDLRNHFTLMIANLALADFIAGSVTEPTAAVFTLLESQGLHPPVALVYVTHLSYFISVQASVLTLVGLTSDRYLAITRPLWYRANMTIAKATVITLVIWTCAVVLSMLYFRVGFPLYSFIFANTVVAGAMSVFVFTYVRILRAIRVRVQTMMSLNASTLESQTNQREALWESKLTKTYLLMLSCFLACYVPSCALIYALHFCLACSCAVLHVLRDVHFLLVLLSSAINPILYAWRLSNFRRAFLAVVKCGKQGTRQDGLVMGNGKSEGITIFSSEENTRQDTKVKRNEKTEGMATLAIHSNTAMQDSKMQGNGKAEGMATLASNESARQDAKARG